MVDPANLKHNITSLSISLHMDFPLNPQNFQLLLKRDPLAWPQVRASLLRGAGPPSPAARLSCLSPIVETNSRTAVLDEEDDQPEVELYRYQNQLLLSHFLCCLDVVFLCPGGPAPHSQGGGCNGAGAGASEDRGAIPRSFRVVRRIQS